MKQNQQLRNKLRSVYEGFLSTVAVLSIASMIIFHNAHLIQTVFAFSGTDDDAVDFNSGSHTKTQWNSGTGRVELFDEFPQTELPDNGLNSGYVDMTNNVLLLHMNESSWTGAADEVTDDSGNGNHGTRNNAASITRDGRMNNGGSFGGVSDFIEIADDPSLALTSQITVQAWVNPDNLLEDTSSEVFVSQEGAGGWSGYTLGYNNSYVAGGLSFILFDGAQGHTVVSDVDIPAGEWHHVAATYDGSTMRLFLDGQEVANTVASFSINDPSNSINIGRHRWFGDSNFAGKMDEVGIWTRALSAAEIRESYNRQNRGIQPELPNQGSNDWWLDMTNNIGLWHMDESSWNGTADEVVDGSGNGNHGVRVGSANTTSAGQLANAGNFNGTSDYVEIADSPSLTVSNAITVSAWFYADSNLTTASERVLLSQEGAAGWSGWTLGWVAPFGYRWIVHGGGQSGALDYTGTVTGGEWHHAAATFDGTTMISYLDGEEVKRGTNAPAAITDPSNSLWIGRHRWTGSQYWDGKIDEAAVWNEVLTAQDIKMIYDQQAPNFAFEIPDSTVTEPWFDTSNLVFNMQMNESGWDGTADEVIDSSTNGNDGQSFGGAAVVEDGKLGRSGYFDGVNDYVSIPHDASIDLGSGSFSMSAWIKGGDSLATSSMLVAKINGSPQSFPGYQMGYNNIVGEFFSVSDGADSAYAEAATGDTSYGYVDDQEWHHWVGTYDGSEAKLYIDGIQVGSDIDPEDGSNTENLHIGRRSNGVYFNGNVDEVALFDDVLTAEEVRNLFRRQHSAYGGMFDSQVFDGGSTQTWDTLSWVPQAPFAKALPDSGGIETVYNESNVDMSDNVFLLHMDESSGSITDTSGNGATGSYNGTRYANVGKFNDAIGFDGVDDYVNFGAPASTELGTNFTIETWVKPDKNNAESFIVARRGNGAYYWYEIRTTAGGTVYASVQTGGASDVRAECYAAPVTFGEWNHIALVRDGTNVIVYVNGEEECTGSNGSLGSITYGSQPLYIGAVTTNYVSNTPVSHFKGLIDEVAFYNSSLNAADIAARYRRGADRIRFQVRSCDDSACAGETFIGPDGTASTFYTEENGTDNQLPSLTLTNVTDNQYIQYRAFFESELNATPELDGVTLDGSDPIVGGGGGGGGGGSVQWSTQEVTGSDVALYDVPDNFSFPEVSAGAAQTTFNNAGGTSADDSLIVLDQSASDAGFILQLQANDFVGPGGSTIASNNLSFVTTPSGAGGSDINGVTHVNAQGAAIAPYDVDEASAETKLGLGSTFTTYGTSLDSPANVLQTTDSTGISRFEVNLSFQLDVPEFQAPGAYSGRLIYTLIPN